MSKKTKHQKHAEHVAEKKHAQEVHEIEAAHAHDDDLIVVPKGTSRAKFYAILFLTIFVLLAFMITGPMMATLSGGNPGERIYMTWTHESGPQSLTVRDFTAQKQQYNRLMSLLFQRRGAVADEETASFLVQDRIAQDAGVQITDRDLATFLRDTMQITDVAAYDSFVRQYGLNTIQFEELLRRWMRVRRYENFLAAGLDFADASDVEKQWNDQFREYKFQYVQVDPEAFDEEARATPPTDEELQTWFDALPPFQKNPFMSEPKSSGEFAVYYFGTDVPTTLLEKYPMPEDSDLDALAENYYNIVFQSRFAREVPEESDEPDETDDETGEPEETDDESGEPDEPQEEPFLPFEEVKETCLAEAPIYYAMRDWLTALQAIAGDPAQELDFAAEATGVGLVFDSDPTARTLTEWGELETFGGSRLSNMMRFASEGRILSTVIVEKNAILVGRASSVIAAAVPEISEIKEEVLDAWASEKRAEVALEKVKAVYDSLRENPDESAPLLGGIDVDEAAFAEKVTAAGFEVSTRDWRDRMSEPEGGWLEADPIEMYLRINATAFILSDGQVMEPALNGQKSAVFMVRMVAGRDPENVKMKPGDIQNIERTVASTARMDFGTQAFGFDALADKFDLQLHREPVADDPTTP